MKINYVMQPPLATLSCYNNRYPPADHDQALAATQNKSIFSKAYEITRIESTNDSSVGNYGTTIKTMDALTLMRLRYTQLSKSVTLQHIMIRYKSIFSQETAYRHNYKKEESTE